MKLDINSDMGEGFGRWSVSDDDAMMEIVSSANIACGYHAGDHDIIAHCVRLAKARGVAIGAHPGFRDLLGFGRRPMPVDRREMCNMLAYQVGALQGVAAVAGHRITHVSYHAAYGNAAQADESLAEEMARVLAALDPAMIFYAQPGTVLERAARKAGLRVMTLFLADRAYRPDGSLVPRGQPGAVISDHDALARRVERFVETAEVVCPDGTVLAMPAKGILVHSDTPGSVGLATIVRHTLDRLKVEVAPSTELAD